MQPEILAHGQIKRALSAVEKEIVSKIRYSNIDKKVSKKLTSEIQDIFKNAYIRNIPSGNNDNDRLIIHHLSNIEKRKILGWTDEVLNEIPEKMKSINNTLETLTIELQKTENALKKAPSDEVIGPLVNELNSISREIGNNETILKQIDENIKQLQYKLKNTNYQMKNLELEAKNYEKLQRGVALAQKVQVALEEYEIQLKNEKIGQLSQSLLDCLNELMHKEVYHGVVLTFAVFKHNISK
jgi:DNA sulfur modification protein DndD